MWSLQNQVLEVEQGLRTMVVAVEMAMAMAMLVPVAVSQTKMR
jgi:hypothetical protein